ncbi:VOC family protein [Paracoccus sp. (in: a-proteobacteria)]|uniref:VOC family protein n=1 Tax=Paracoccus sp. TaxID=267 RepID=UPI00289D5BA3|nr:VOC family protein [Paracoccus sp. (in: a-proteobacteria)]
MTTGIHHVTLITRKVQANIDFYLGFLGLRLIKRTGGYEDSEQLHLFYGDQLGSPGSLVSFLVWEDGAPGRTGHGQVAEIAFAVPLASIGDWLTRAMNAHVPVEGPSREFGEPVLRLRDPDGVIVKLVGVDLAATAPLPDPIAPRRIRSVTLWSEDAEATADFVSRFGYQAAGVEGNARRLKSDTDVVDIRNVRGYVPSIPGTGIFDHVAFRAPDVGTLRQMRLDLKDAESVTNVHDRKYFLSLYVREPGGTLIEFATDGPGFTVDEAPEHLGETLFFPPEEQARAEDLRVILPQFALPGGERIPMRELPFIHRFHTPDAPDGSVILLLHGTGGNEADLMPLAHRLNPHATLLGLRGRSQEEGVARWFRRFDAMRFDQEDNRAEAAAFDAFMHDALRSYGLDSARITVLGYSNGANFAAAVMGLYPGLIKRAILLRAVAVLEELPQVDLSGAEVLMINGENDPYLEGGSVLADWLRACQAELDLRLISAGHQLTGEDLNIALDWMRHRLS